MCLILQQMLMQVLSLTPDQINGLPPSEREAIQNLVCLDSCLPFFSSLMRALFKAESIFGRYLSVVAGLWTILELPGAHQVEYICVLKKATYHPPRHQIPSLSSVMMADPFAPISIRLPCPPNLLLLSTSLLLHQLVLNAP
jgi:hypothetical protein